MSRSLDSVMVIFRKKLALFVSLLISLCFCGPVMALDYDDDLGDCAEDQDVIEYMQDYPGYERCHRTYLRDDDDGCYEGVGYFRQCLDSHEPGHPSLYADGNDCIDCDTKTDWGEVLLGSLGILAPAFVTGYVNHRWANSYTRVNKQRYDALGKYADAMKAFPQACTNGFDSYLSHRSDLGINSALSSDGAGAFFKNCSSLSQYAGFNGLFANGFGGSGNPWQSGGYSQGFLSGMMGPPFMGGGFGGGSFGGGFGGGFPMGGGGLQGGLNLRLGGGFGGGSPMGGGFGGGSSLEEDLAEVLLEEDSAEVLLLEEDLAEVLPMEEDSAEVLLLEEDSAEVFLWEEDSAEVFLWEEDLAEVLLWEEDLAEVFLWEEDLAEVFLWEEDSAEVFLWEEDLAEVFLWEEDSAEVLLWEEDSAEVFLWEEDSAEVLLEEDLVEVLLVEVFREA